LLAPIPVPHIPRALQSPLGLACLDDLAEFLSEGASVGTAPRRIYVSRDDARLRRVLNESEILPLLNEAEFEPVALSRLPIGRQVSLFRHAEAVVAPHGAGLAHIAWCRPGTKVVEFFPDPDGPRGCVKNASFDYWLIAQMRGLSHSCHLAGPVSNRSDGFRIEKHTLLAALREAEF
jgi:capsular polysaccharide biosynthesis protein